MNVPASALQHSGDPGSYLPERVVPNEALTQFPPATLPLITEKTGISSRRYAADDQFTSDLGAEAARVCLSRASRRS